jgi:hypothetical protein
MHEEQAVLHVSHVLEKIFEKEFIGHSVMQLSRNLKYPSAHTKQDVAYASVHELQEL